MRRYSASTGSGASLRLPAIALVGVMLGVGGWIAQANWSFDAPEAASPSPEPVLAAATGDVDTSTRQPRPTRAAPVPVAAPRLAALPPLSAPARVETSGSNPAVAALPSKTVAPPKPKEPSVLAAMHAQIAQMKVALKLTRDQEPYWPPVEALLRDIARQQAKLRPAATTSVNGKPVKMKIGDADMQRLTSVAFPLLMSLREDQRRDALRLAQAMGFETAGAY